MSESAVGDFDRDTRVEGGDGVYTATVSPEWELWGPVGGYMATIALRAGAAEAKIPHPVSIYAQFLRPARFDRIDAKVTVVQAGRRAESIRVSLSQEGKPVVEALLRTALPGDGLTHQAAEPPEIPPPESLPTMEQLWNRDVPSFPFWNNVESRIALGERFQPNFEPMPPHWREWYRFRPKATFEDPVLDAGRALVLVDLLGWPSAWLAHPTTRFRGPNLDVVAFFHQSAQSSEWLLCEQICQVGAGGLLGPSARIFDRSGRLVASGGGQLLCVPGPE